MAAKGHPWLFLRFVVLSGRMVRRPLEYLQRPMCSGNSASYISVLYILAPPLSSHTTAEIIAKVTGIAPLHDVAVLHLVAGAAVVGIPSVDVVHPAGQTAHVELIEVIDPLYIGAVIYRSPVGFHVDGVVPTYPLENIEYALALAELHLRGGKTMPSSGTRNFLFSTHLSMLSRMVSQEMEKVQVWVVVVSTVVSCGSTGVGLPSGTGSVMY